MYKPYIQDKGCVASCNPVVRVVTDDLVYLLYRSLLGDQSSNYLTTKPCNLCAYINTQRVPAKAYASRYFTWYLEPISSSTSSLRRHGFLKHRRRRRIRPHPHSRKTPSLQLQCLACASPSHHPRRPASLLPRSREGDPGA